MASYATLAQLREYLTQVPAGATNDALLQTVLDRATAIVDDELGFAFGGYDAAATTRRFDGGGGKYLHLPYHESGSLVAASVKPVNTDLTAGTAYTYYEADPEDHTCLWRAAGWPRGRYEATAKWGYGAAPAEIVEVTLELAINLWGIRDARQISDVVGVEGGGAVGYNRALTNRQRAIIDSVRVRYGIWGFA